MNMVVLEVAEVETALARAAKTMEAGAADQEARLTFATPELLWAVLGAKRWELLKVMCGAGAMSIREAARRAGRDVKAVHRDVTALLRAGVVVRTAEGRVLFPYDAIRVEFVLRAA